MVRGPVCSSCGVEARLSHDPVDAWASIAQSDEKRKEYQAVRGLGGFSPFQLGTK